MDSHFREIAGVVWTVGLALALALTVFVHLLVRRVTTPLSALSRWAAALDAKSLVAAPPDFTYPELNTLAQRIRDSMLTEREALERERCFLQYSSHELRTPISIVRASVECLDRMLDGPRDTAREKRAVQRLNRASAAMTHLVETLLWLGRKADTPPPATMIDLEQIVRDVVADARQLYTHKDVACVVETQSCMLPLQVGAAEIVVGNVIRNAFQHTLRGIIHIRQAGTTVEVTNYMAQSTPKAHAPGFGVGLELTRRLAACFGWAFTSHAHSGYNTSTLCFTQAGDAPAAREEPHLPRPCRGLITALTVVLSLCVTACEHREETEQAAPLVRYAVATPERVVLTTRAPGRVAAFAVSEVRPQVDGIIQERLFEEGALVERGQVLYRLDAARYRAAHDTSTAALAEAEAAVVALAQQEKRRRNLSRENAVSRQELDNAISAHEQARARIARARAAQEATAIDLAYTDIRAPIAGRIGKALVTPGALVTAHQAAPLAVIWQTDRVYVDITQSSADMLRLRRALAEGTLARGDAANVRLTLEDGSPYTHLGRDGARARTPISGSLLFAEMAVSQNTGGVLQRVAFDNPDGLLLPGMHVVAIFEEGVRERCVLVPQGCVLPDDAGGHYLFVVLGERDERLMVERRPVRLGRRMGNRWVVEEGVKPGERYIVEGLQKAAHGAMVRGERIMAAETR